MHVSVILDKESVLGTCLPLSSLQNMQLTSATSLTSLCLSKPRMHRHHLGAQGFIYCSKLKIPLTHKYEKEISLLCNYSNFLSKSLSALTPHQDSEPHVMLFLQTVCPLLPHPTSTPSKIVFSKQIHHLSSSSPLRLLPFCLFICLIFWEFCIQ